MRRRRSTGGFLFRPSERVTREKGKPASKNDKKPEKKGEKNSKNAKNYYILESDLFSGEKLIVFTGKKGWKQAKKDHSEMAFYFSAEVSELWDIARRNLAAGVLQEQVDKWLRDVHCCKKQLSGWVVPGAPETPGVSTQIQTETGLFCGLTREEVEERRDGLMWGENRCEGDPVAPGVEGQDGGQA